MASLEVLQSMKAKIEKMVTEVQEIQKGKPMSPRLHTTIMSAICLLTLTVRLKSLRG